MPLPRSSRAVELPVAATCITTNIIDYRYSTSGWGRAARQNYRENKQNCTCEHSLRTVLFTYTFFLLLYFVSSHLHYLLERYFVSIRHANGTTYSEYISTATIGRFHWSILEVPTAKTMVGVLVCLIRRAAISRTEIFSFRTIPSICVLERKRGGSSQRCWKKRSRSNRLFPAIMIAFLWIYLRDRIG